MSQTEKPASRVRLKKSFGQHFLVEQHYAERIAAAIPAVDSEPVLEIGPGGGALSVFLKRRFPSFHAVEMDRDMVPLVKAKLGEGTYTVHRADALEFDFLSVGTPLHVVGNLPYNIGALIIKKALLLSEQVASCTFMVQKEVARRIAAEPGSKTRGFLSVFCQYFGNPVILFDVPPGAFRPPPKVVSSVFQLLPRAEEFSRLPAGEWVRFFRFVTNGFTMRRKMLINGLGRCYPGAPLDQAFSDCTVSPEARAENLSVEQWISLYRKLCTYL